jgi:DNA-binding GntR family transcriptional regulator
LKLPEQIGRGRTQNAGLVEASLREEIISLKLAPGSVLSRIDLQSRFGVSSTPIRDALLRLQEEQLVEIFPQSATIVSAIDPVRAARARFLRRSVELELVRLLALEEAPETIENLRSLLRQQQALAEVGEYEAFSRADRDFHKVMFDSLHMTELWHLIQKQSGHIDRLRRLNLYVGGKMDQVVAAHKRIVDAIAAADPAAAQAALRDHLSTPREVIETLRERYPEYFRENRSLLNEL